MAGVAVVGAGLAGAGEGLRVVPGGAAIVAHAVRPQVKPRRTNAAVGRRGARSAAQRTLSADCGSVVVVTRRSHAPAPLQYSEVYSEAAVEAGPSAIAKEAVIGTGLAPRRGSVGEHAEGAGRVAELVGLEEEPAGAGKAGRVAGAGFAAQRALETHSYSALVIALEGDASPGSEPPKVRGGIAGQTGPLSITGKAVVGTESA